MLKVLVFAVSLAIAGPVSAATPTLFQPAAGRLGALANGKSYAVTLNRNAIEAAVTEGSLRIDLPGNQFMLARTVSHHFLHDGNLTWVGKVQTKRGERTVIITMGKDAAFGELVAPDGSSMQLETRKGVTYLTRPDPKLDALYGPMYRNTPDYVDVGFVAPSKAQLASTRQALALTSSPVVDVFVGYTPGLVAR